MLGDVVHPRRFGDAVRSDGAMTGAVHIERARMPRIGRAGEHAKARLRHPAWNVAAVAASLD
jgi:hypothetical protein